MTARWTLPAYCALVAVGVALTVGNYAAWAMNAADGRAVAAAVAAGMAAYVVARRGAR